MNDVDTILVGFTINPDGSDILVVARKWPNGNPDIINAIEGQEAKDIYDRLVGDNSLFDRQGA